MHVLLCLSLQRTLNQVVYNYWLCALQITIALELFAKYLYLVKLSLVYYVLETLSGMLITLLLLVFFILRISLAC